MRINRMSLLSICLHTLNAGTVFVFDYDKYPSFGGFWIKTNRNDEVSPSLTIIVNLETGELKKIEQNTKVTERMGSFNEYAYSGAPLANENKETNNK